MDGTAVGTSGALLWVRGGTTGGRRERGVRERSGKRERRSVTRVVIATCSRPSFCTSTRHQGRNGVHNLPHGRDHTTSEGQTVTSCGSVPAGHEELLSALPSGASARNVSSPSARLNKRSRAIMIMGLSVQGPPSNAGRL